MIMVVHGGAGDRRPSKDALEKLAESLSAGFDLLSSGGDAIDAVVASITVLEDSGVFNAGAGGNLQLDGVMRLDASIMEGNNLKAGSVIGLEGIRNPIRAARKIVDLPHVMLTNKGARKIADSIGLERLQRPCKKSLGLLEDIKKKKGAVIKVYKKYFSTVGAVAADGKGNLAAGASTGGILAMLPGRVGDTPVIGAGVYAENSLGAVSCTGTGEEIIRLSLAKEICMNLKGCSPSVAARSSLKRLMGIEGSAGVIVINRRGQFSIVHTTEFMAAGYCDGRGMIAKEGFRRVK